MICGLRLAVVSHCRSSPICCKWPPGPTRRLTFLSHAVPMLVLGTANRKKGIELADLVRPVGVEVRTLADFPGDFAGGGERRHLRRQRPAEGRRLRPASGPVGSGRRQRTGGRCCSATGRGSFPPDIPAPTPATSRTTGCCWSELGDTPLERRTARFVCHIAVADPSGDDPRRERRLVLRANPLRAPRRRRIRLRPAVRDRRVPSHVRRIRAEGEGRAEPPRPSHLRESFPL